MPDVTPGIGRAFDYTHLDARRMGGMARALDAALSPQRKAVQHFGDALGMVRPNTGKDR